MANRAGSQVYIANLQRRFDIPANYRRPMTKALIQVWDPPSALDLAKMAPFCNLWGPHFWPHSELVEFAQSNHLLIAAILDQSGTWQGCAIVQKSGAMWDILFLFVPENARLHGHGKMLTNYLCDLAKRDQARILLEVRRSNAPAIRTYEAAGFKQHAVRSKYYKDGEDALIYEFKP